MAIFNGPCTVTQSESGSNTIFEVKMGEAESFMFAGVKGQPNWMTGPDRVHFTDLPNGGIFHWKTFALVVAE